jgi:hypothetical protein
MKVGPLPQGDPKTDVAWLSSARAVRCTVKSANERNPRRVLPASNVGNSHETAGVSRRKVGMTSSQHGSYAWGFTHATMGATEGSNAARWSKSQKYAPSSDCSLQLDYMKSESLVNAGQLYCVEYVPGSCTHRPSSHLNCLHPKSVA